MTKIEYIEAQGDNGKYDANILNPSLMLSRMKYCQDWIPCSSRWQLKVRCDNDEVQSGNNCLQDEIMPRKSTLQLKVTMKSTMQRVRRAIWPYDFRVNMAEIEYLTAQDDNEKYGAKRTTCNLAFLTLRCRTKLTLHKIRVAVWKIAHFPHCVVGTFTSRIFSTKGKINWVLNSRIFSQKKAERPW